MCYEPRVITAREVAERARAGRLRGPDGQLLPAFACEVASVRTIASRARRSAVLYEHQGDVDLDATRKLYRELSVRARRRVQSAETGAEIKEAAKMLSELRELEGTLAKAPAPGANGALRASILASDRASPVLTPSPQPVRATEPKPAPKADPKPEGPEPPGAWMRRALADLAQGTEPAASSVASGSAAGGEDMTACESTGHVAFGSGRRRR
jgi:hypothetical protein